MFMIDLNKNPPAQDRTGDLPGSAYNHHLVLGVLEPVLAATLKFSERLITLHSMLVKNLQFAPLIFPGNHKTEMCPGFAVFPTGMSALDDFYSQTLYH